MNFDVAGPSFLTRHRKKSIITQESLTDLKRELDASHPGLAKACGCYVFAIKAGKGYTPYYVGQACKLLLPREAMNPTNREKYNRACEGKGMPTLFFIPKLTPQGRYRTKGGSSRTIDFLERWLVAKALKKNPNL